jgi:hypothetical protein
MRRHRHIVTELTPHILRSLGAGMNVSGSGFATSVRDSTTACVLVAARRRLADLSFDIAAPTFQRDATV